MSESNHEARYTLSLKDMLTGKLHEAEGAATRLGTAMSGARSMAGQLAGALSIGFGIFAGVEFIKQGVEAMEKIHYSESQLRAGLESTKNAAGLTFEELAAGAKKFSSQLLYSRSDVMDMQAQLLTFPSVTKESFGDASQAIIDMSTRLHHGLNETAIMVGKALQDPEHGITALRRVGVNFNEEQTKIIKNMAATGHEIQAQQMIIKELGVEFSGSAKAAFDADPLARFNKMIGSAKLEMGELVLELLHRVMPALEGMAGAIKSAIVWLREHKGLLKDIAVVAGIAAGAYFTYNGILAAGILIQKAKAAWDIIQLASLYTTTGAAGGLSVVMTILTAAQYALNVAIRANPLGLLITAIALVVTVLYEAYKHVGWFHAAMSGLWAALKFIGAGIADIFIGVGKVIRGALELNPSMMIEGGKQTIDAAKRLGTGIKEAFMEGAAQGMAEFDKAHAEAKITTAPINILKAGKTAEIPKPTKTTTGNKSTVINIKIDSLVKQFTVATKNLTEGHEKVKELIVQTLLGAVNDSQRVAGD